MSEYEYAVKRRRSPLGAKPNRTIGRTAGSNQGDEGDTNSLKYSGVTGLRIVVRIAACHAFFTIAAHYDLGRHDEADKILAAVR